MNFFKFDGNDLAADFVRSYGLKGGVAAAIAVALFAGSRAVGLVDFVGYQTGSQAGVSLAKATVEPLNISTPAYLKKGEKLVAEYDTNITSGNLKLYVRKGLIPAPFMRETADRNKIENAGKGTYEFTAPEDGWYWPKSKMMSGWSTDRCKENKQSKDLFQAAADPTTACGSRAMTFDVWWSVGD